MRPARGGGSGRSSCWAFSRTRAGSGSRSSLCARSSGTSSTSIPSSRIWWPPATTAKEERMADEQIHANIEQLVEEEQALYDRASHEDGLTEDERRRLEAIRVQLDQCWDL